MADRAGGGDRGRPGDHGHRDLQDRQCLRKPGRRHLSQDRGRRRRDRAGRGVAGRRRAGVGQRRRGRGLRQGLQRQFRLGRGRGRQRPRARDRRCRRHAHPFLEDGRGRRASRHLHPWLRRRSLQLDVQSGRACGEPHHLRHRPPRPWRLDQGRRRRRSRRVHLGRARLHGRPEDRESPSGRPFHGVVRRRWPWRPISPSGWPPPP